MKLLRTTALTAALMTAAVPSLTTQANAQWGWRGGGWGWGGAALGIAAAGALIGTALAAPFYTYGYGYPAYGYGYPAYGYGYPAYGYGYPAYGYGYPASAYGYGYPGYGGYGYPGYGVYAYASVRRHQQHENLCQHGRSPFGDERVAPLVEVLQRRAVLICARRHSPRTARCEVTGCASSTRSDSVTPYRAAALNVKVDPTGVVNSTRKGGFKMWSEAEMAAYQERWQIGTWQRVWLDVLAYTGCGGCRRAARPPTRPQRDRQAQD